MLVSDVLKSCAHAPVAGAAVASIGGDFADHVRSHASARGVSIGDFAALHVRRFSEGATERDYRVVAARMRGEDLALLAGLQAVVRRMMDSGALPSGNGRGDAAKVRPDRSDSLISVHGLAIG